MDLKMTNTLLRWYKSNSKIKNALALLIMTVFMLAFLNLKNVTITRDKLIKEGSSSKPVRLYWDILIWYVIFGYDPSEFAAYNFCNKSVKERLSFSSSNEQILFSKSINRNANLLVLEDKSYASDYFNKYYKREHIIVNSQEDHNKFNLFSSQYRRFFYKPLKGSCGKDSGVANISIDDPCSLFNKLVSNGPYILEELINQCDEMALFNQSSVNTIRTTMLRTKDGIELLFGFIRCGRKGCAVDNGGAGGIIIPYDIETGKLGKYGFDENGRKYTRHPDSDIEFEGFQIPRWNEILGLSKTITEMLPDFHYVGWDIAVTNDGVQLVEGNSRPMFVGLQGLHTTGFRKEINCILRTCSISSSFKQKQKESLS
jgi:hypothetical protein